MNWAHLLSGSRRSATARARATSPVVESLEGRQLLSASAVPTLHGGVLTVVGTPRADDIRISMNPAHNGRVVVDVNGKQYEYPKRRLRSIVVDGGRGKDFIGADPTNGQIRVPLTLLGGAGRDTLVGGKATDTLDGGAGGDVLLGRAGRDALDGGRGADWVDGGAGRDVMTGGAGRDTFVQTARADRVSGGFKATVLRKPQPDPVSMPWDIPDPVQQPIVQTPADDSSTTTTTTTTTHDNNTDGLTSSNQPPSNPTPVVVDQDPVTPPADNTPPNDSTDTGTANDPVGIIVDAPQPEPVPFYDATLFLDRPDLTQYGMKGTRLQDVYHLLTADKSAIDPAKVWAEADIAAARGVPLILDQEIWPTDIRKTPVDQVTAAVQKMVTILDLVHARQPGVKVGYYGTLPLRDYWTPVQYQYYNSTNPTYAQQVWLPKYQAWQAANDALRPVAERVDFICPSLYTLYDDPANWTVYAQANIDEAKRYGKPVLPFLWMEYHDSNAELKGQLIPADQWQAQIDLARSSADGVVIWGGYLQQWNPDTAWWSVIQDEINQTSAAAETVIG